jgi:hypothetical protein
MELSKEGDKRGQRRAKEFSEGFRTTCRLIKQRNIILLCSNQIREGERGADSPGGQAIKFYSSLRIRVGAPVQNSKITRSIKYNGKELEKVIGIKSVCYIKKSTVDVPFRTADVYIVFGVGIDDIRANLQYVKDMTSDNTYVVNGKSCVGMDAAIAYVEENNLAEQLKEHVMDIWYEVEDKFNRPRVPKIRT